MGDINSIFAAMLTRNNGDSGTDSPIVLIANVQGNDTIQYTFPDTSQEDQQQGQANLYEIPVHPVVPLSRNTLDETYFRVGIRGDDAWEPEHFFVWGTAQQPFAVIPLGIVLNAKTLDIERRLNAGVLVDTKPRNLVLSTNESEGDLSFPLLPVRKATNEQPLSGLILIMETADSDGAGTDSTIVLQIHIGNNLVVDFTIPDTPQEEQEQGQANLYLIPVGGLPFSKRDLLPGSVNLIIKGDDAWLPKRMFLFGVDIADGQPIAIISLVHLTAWNLGALSTDGDEGLSSVALPLTP